MHAAAAAAQADRSTGIGSINYEEPNCEDDAGQTDRREGDKCESDGKKKRIILFFPMDRIS